MLNLPTHDGAINDNPNPTPQVLSLKTLQIGSGCQVNDKSCFDDKVPFQRDNHVSVIKIRD